MSSNSPLPARAVFIKDLLPVAICSAASHCLICQEGYNEDHAPVLLRPCGHIFGRPCILEWFEEGANTCPLDRDELFDNRGDWSLVSFSATRHTAEGGTPTRRIRRTSAHYLFFSGEIIGVNGELTREGCNRIVKDLWYHAQVFFRQLRQSVNDADVLSVDEEALEGPIYDALPLGISVPSAARPMLVNMMRMMLARQDEAWEDGREAHMPRDEMDEYVEELWAICGEADRVQHD